MMTLKRVKVVVIDIDGVLTDGKIVVSNTGDIKKKFNLKDLDAISQLKALGINVSCISGENTEYEDFFVSWKLFKHVFLGCKDKIRALETIAKEEAVGLDEVLYIGDGKYDIPPLNLVGIPCCPADAIDEVKEISEIVLKRKGGEGCLAELYSILSFEKNIRDTDVDENVEDVISKRINHHKEILEKVISNKHIAKSIDDISNLIIEVYKKGGKLLVCGNGGSAADAQHMAGELVSRLYVERKALHAVALNSNTSIITAIANDNDYETIFSRQVEAIGNSGDVLLGISTSGNSPNVINAFKTAKSMGIRTVLLAGESGCKDIHVPVEYEICIPSTDTPRIQEMHIMCIHIICEIVEKYFYERR